MRMQSRAAASEDGSPAHTRSVRRIAASARSRWRESSGTSFGSSMLRPGVSSASVMLREPQQLLEVGHACRPGARRRSARTAAPARGRRSCRRRRSEVARRVPRPHRELARRERGLRAQEAGVEADRVARRPSGPPRGRASSARGMVELHADLRGEPLRRPRSSVASASSDSGSNLGPWFRITSAQCTGGPSWAFAARRDGRVPGRLGPDSCRWTETTFGVFRDGCVAVFCPPLRRTRSPPTVARVEWL